MDKPVMQQKKEEVSYFNLNNQLNIPTKDGRIQLDKDREAVKAYFLEHVNNNIVYFKDGLEEKIDYLLDNDYIEKEFIEKYEMKFIKKLFKFLYSKKFRFKSFMSAYKFYTQYALKTNDGKRFLELYEDRIAFNALYLAKGDEELAMDIAKEMIEQRFQPATPSFMNIGRKRRGEFVSCFIISADDNMESISRVISSSLQLSKRGGGVGRVNLCRQ